MIINNTKLNSFISNKVINRQKSLFENDLNSNNLILSKKLKKKKVLVIGGAGTIGANYIKCLLKFDISELIVVDINENGLVELIRTLRSSSLYKIPKVLKTYAIDFGDKLFIKYFRENGPYDYVANFAAHKHVRNEKDIFSIHAMINNNILKNRKLLNILSDLTPINFFCVSTDKAANPVNIMGASKKIMEDLLISYSSRFSVTTARFANVAFSNGSLLDGSINRIFNNQPISCPTDIKRYFVSPEESGQICLIASILGKSGEVYFPNLDEKNLKSFDTIIIDFINYLGFKILKCTSEEEAIIASKNHKLNEIPVYFFESDTTGEKKTEEFYTENELINLERYSGLGFFKINNNNLQYNVDKLCDDIDKLFKKEFLTKEIFLKTISKYLPNFNHLEYGKNLDDKM